MLTNKIPYVKITNSFILIKDKQPAPNTIKESNIKMYLCNNNIKTPHLIVLIIAVFLLQSVSSQVDTPYPFSTNTEKLTVWNGTEYIPFFMKGINLGISVPGTFPGELAATKKDYIRWIDLIKEAGFNCIRLYTLHYPRFYEVIDSINRANPQNPLLIIQGVWLEEEFPDNSNDFYTLSSSFKYEIEENIDCVHGNRTITHRFGKAYGEYNVDASKWCLAYILGRETHPVEIITTNTENIGVNSFAGNHLRISDASPVEAWITSMLDYAIEFEHTGYNTQRPISFSSWPTLDPLEHIGEVNTDEDIVSINLAKIEIVNAPAGMFISYHAYPYYPDFVSHQSSYQSFYDDLGPNSYIGYLTELKSHYYSYPLIIGEYGVPSSWTIAHYSTSGMNHGGFDEYNQGLTNMRMLNSIETTGCGGGIQFAWIDEWFKRTWISDPLDYNPESRVLWHNISSAEQNFGLVKYEKSVLHDTIIPYNQSSSITYVSSDITCAFLELEIGLKQPLDNPGELWVGIDTYDKDLGELILPTGDSLPSRCEFSLCITNYSCKLYVTEAYDIFGNWHNVSKPEQLYHSIPTDNAPWDIVRIRNNEAHSDVQFIGNLKINLEQQPKSSKDGVTISDDKINIRIPWTYLNVVAPNQMRVMHDYRSTIEKEDTVSDGLTFSVLYKDQWHIQPDRLTWEPWAKIERNTVTESLKKSYFVMKDNLQKFNTPAIAVIDTYSFNDSNYPAFIPQDEGLLSNDFDLDGNKLLSLVIENPKNGQVNLNFDGSFYYTPLPGFTGIDTLIYAAYDWNTLSTPSMAIFQVNENNTPSNISKIQKPVLEIFPNPGKDYIIIKFEDKMQHVQIFDLSGHKVGEYTPYKNKTTIDISSFSTGTYTVVVKSNSTLLTGRFVKN